MKKHRLFITSFLFVLILSNFKLIKVQGDSMYPTLKNNTYAVVDRYLHKLFNIQKNDIMLLEVGGKEVVKKIVGFPGEKLEIEGKKLVLENNEIFVLGENLPKSIDSREYGPLSSRKIIGKVLLTF